jgi:hypothetical protein
MPRILIVGPIVAAALVLAAAAVAAPTPSPSYDLTGVATGGAQGALSALGGAARGSSGDHAVWETNVIHAPFAACATIGSSCAMTGGTFTLTSNNGFALAGTIMGGQLTLTAQPDRCGTQVFDVTALVSTQTSLEQFTGQLTQHRAPVRGVCTVVVANVQGTLAVVDDGGSF